MKKRLEKLKEQREQLALKLDMLDAEISDLENPDPVKLTEEEIGERLGYPVKIIKDK